MKRYISDLHLGHANVLKFDQRPFLTLDEMHETIINNWNSVVDKTDDVYILGDFAWKSDVGLDILKQLNGNKFLIRGNHDSLNGYMELHFVWVKDMETIKDEGRHVVLCHYPIAHWRNADQGYIHLYGHIHAGRDSRPFDNYKLEMYKRDIPYECYNVGCMLPYMNYTPRTLDEIIASANTGMESMVSVTAEKDKEIDKLTGTVKDLKKQIDELKEIKEEYCVLSKLMESAIVKQNKELEQLEKELTRAYNQG